MKPELTNEQHAKAFLARYYQEEKAHLRKLRGLAKSARYHGARYDAEVEDVLLVTVTKCYQGIEKRGLRDDAKYKEWDKAYDAYFVTALTNHMKRYADKKGIQRKRDKKYGAEVRATGSDRSLPELFDLGVERVDPEQDYEDLACAAIDSIADKYQDVLYMLADGLTYNQIGRVLELSLGKVKMRIMTARRMVKSYIQERLVDNSRNQFEKAD